MKSKNKCTILILLASAIVALFGSSCRTVNGFGQDVDHVGEHIQHASR